MAHGKEDMKSYITLYIAQTFSFGITPTVKRLSGYLKF